MQIVLDLDELRYIATLSVNAAEKMEEANSIIGTVISKHDWKCPERAPIDESLEKIKENTVVLNNSFSMFSTQIVEIANDFTDYLNDQIKTDTEYSEGIACLLAQYNSDGPVNTTVSSGNAFGQVVSSLKDSTMDASNMASLQGADHGINIVDFSLFTNE